MKAPQFQIEDQAATLVHINPRPEKHGEENVPAADLKFSIVDSNELLSMFHPSLRSMLFVESSAEGQLEGVPPALTERRFGGLVNKLRLDYSITGADVVVDVGIGGLSALHLDCVDVDRFALEILDGGSVRIDFRVKSRATSDQIKRLYENMGNELSITVTPPEEKQSALDLPVAVEA